MSVPRSGSKRSRAFHALDEGLLGAVGSLVAIAEGPGAVACRRAVPHASQARRSAPDRPPARRGSASSSTIRRPVVTGHPATRNGRRHLRAGGGRARRSSQVWRCATGVARRMHPMRGRIADASAPDAANGVRRITLTEESHHEVPSRTAVRRHARAVGLGPRRLRRRRGRRRDRRRHRATTPSDHRRRRPPREAPTRPRDGRDRPRRPTSSTPPSPPATSTRSSPPCRPPASRRPSGATVRSRCSPRPTTRSPRCRRARSTPCSPIPTGDLTAILTYHVVEGEVPAADVVGLDGQAVTTVNGATFTVGSVTTASVTPHRRRRQRGQRRPDRHRRPATASSTSSTACCCPADRSIGPPVDRTGSADPGARRPARRRAPESASPDGRATRDGHRPRHRRDRLHRRPAGARAARRRPRGALPGPQPRPS